ncbi:hypothetical protein LXL04_034668 [Taraxacum kok-saghyz]
MSKTAISISTLASSSLRYQMTMTDYFMLMLMTLHCHRMNSLTLINQCELRSTSLDYKIEVELYACVVYDYRACTSVISEASVSHTVDVLKLLFGSSDVEVMRLALLGHILAAGVEQYLINYFRIVGPKVIIESFEDHFVKNMKDMSLSCVSNDIIAPGLSTQRISHPTKPTSKLSVSRINLTRVLNPFATREPGQPSVRRWGMTTTSHTDPDASLSLLRRISDTSITCAEKDL